MSGCSKKTVRLFCIATVGETHWHFLRGQADYLQRQGIAITLVSSPGPRLEGCQERDQVRCVSVPMTRRMNPFTDCASLARLWWLFWREQPDIVQYSTPKAAILGSIAAALAGISCRIFLARGSVSVSNRGWSTAINRWAEWLTARLSLQVVCVSDSLRTFLREQGVLRSDEGVVIENGMSNGIDAAYFKKGACERGGEADQASRVAVGFVGRMNREKGLADFAEAWKVIRVLFPEVKALLVGRWDTEAGVSPSLRCLLETDPRVELLGEVADIRPLLARMKVLCFPSYREGFPNAPMEAAAAGVPVVAYDAVGTRDAVVDGVTGTLVELGDTQALAVAVGRYLKDDPLAKSHGQAGQERAKADFQQLPIWRGMHDVYTKAFDRANKRRRICRTYIKPSLEKASAALTLIVLSPLLLTVWLAVRILLGSPVCRSRARRLGSLSSFQMHTFCTAAAQSSSAQLTLRSQCGRVFGRWLRVSHLYKLPTLWNILRGEMSFVGPRSQQSHSVTEEENHHWDRLNLLPGLIGLASVRGESKSQKKMLRYAQFYSKRCTLRMDLWILWLALTKRQGGKGRGDADGVSELVDLGEQHGTTDVVVIGAGGHAKVVVACLRAVGRKPSGIYDDNETLWGASISGVPVVGGIEKLKHSVRSKQQAVIAIGDNQSRRRVATFLQSANIEWTTIKHPSAFVDQTASLGAGSVVCAGAIVQAGAVIGDHVIINTSASVDHDCRVGAYGHIAPGATLTGGCVTEEAGLIGAGSTVLPGRVIGRDALVGAGATVTKDVLDASIVVGCPAQPAGRMVVDRTMQRANWPVFDEQQIAAVRQVLQSGKVNYWTGEQGKAFEREFAEYVGVRHGVAVANGTVALELALAALDIGPGDDVVVPSKTFIATASAVVMRGARPVIADIDPLSQNVTVDTLAAALTPRTRAVIVVHLGGWPCDMPAIMAFAKDRGLLVVEDCAQAHGAQIAGRSVGSFGDMSAFSFCQDKIMTTAGEGGMVLTNDTQRWKKAWSLKDHGKDWDLVHAPAPSGQYRFLHTSFGTNWRMTEAQAAVGRIQLQRLEGWVSERTANAELLRSELGRCPAIEFPSPPNGLRHAYYRLYGIVQVRQLKAGWSRDTIIERITQLGGEVGCGSCGEIYREDAFEEIWTGGRLPAAKSSHETSLAFAVHPGLSRDWLMHLAEVTLGVMREGVSVERERYGRAA